MMRIFATLLVLMIISSSAWAIVTSDAPGSHVVTPGQPAFGLNLDGVAMVGGLLFGEPISFCTGALISDSHVLCAAHCFDVDEDGQLESLLKPFGINDAVLFETAGGLVAIEYDVAAVQVPGRSRKPTWPWSPSRKTHRRRFHVTRCTPAPTKSAARLHRNRPGLRRNPHHQARRAEPC